MPGGVRLGYRADVRTALIPLAALASLASGCLVTTAPERQPPKNEPITLAEEKGTLKSRTREDSPEISRSVGQADGLVVLWPRISPRTEDPAVLELARLVQARLRGIALDTYAEKVEVRPMPERVCPRQGCAAPTLGAILMVQGDTCAVVATLASPGMSSTRLIPWVGGAQVKGGDAPFREPPESYVTITELKKCADLKKALADNAPLGDDDAVGKAVRATRK